MCRLVVLNLISREGTNWMGFVRIFSVFFQADEGIRAPLRSAGIVGKKKSPDRLVCRSGLMSTC